MDGWPGREGSLRDLINRRLDALQHELKAIRVSLMRDKVHVPPEFDNLKLQVASLAEGLRELEERIIQLEQHKSIASWIFRQAITVAVIVVIIYLLGVIR